MQNINQKSIKGANKTKQDKNKPIGTDQRGASWVVE